LCEQVEPQLIPAGELVTVPEPVPAKLTFKVGVARKFAVTAWLVLIVTWQVIDVPEQPPDHPVNRDDEPAFAVSVTVLSRSNSAEQVVPQAIPAGELLTVPDPEPPLATDSCSCGTKVAVTAASAVIGTEHAPDPVHAPDQCAKREPVAAAGVSVTG
jgi:hypothetical protein